MHNRFMASNNHLYSGTLKIGTFYYIYEIEFKWLGYWIKTFKINNMLVADNEKSFNAKINKWKKKLGDKEKINISFDDNKDLIIKGTRLY